MNSTPTKSKGKRKPKRPDVVERPIDRVCPSPENDKIYAPINRKDPELRELVKSIRKRGVLEPIVISRDGYIISGHRRYAAAVMAKLTTVPVRVRADVSRIERLDAFVKELREFNRQRVKTADERVREEIISVDPDAAYQNLVEYRREKLTMISFPVGEIEMGKRKARSEISRARRKLLAAALQVLEEQRESWPITVRQLHYRLLNLRPLIHASKPKSVYRNDLASYRALTDLMARGRLAGEVPWAALIDETRPFTHWNTFKESGEFIRTQLSEFGKGFWRNLQQSQPSHLEIVCEKMTAQKTVESVAMEFCVPVLTGRGYSSLSPRFEMVNRFRASGRDRLIVLIVSDHDPDGETIAESFARSLRDDFQLANVTAFKCALTAEQVERYELPPTMEAKVSSSNFKKFNASHGKHAYELEALRPEDLEQIVRLSITSVLDLEAFDAEVAKEKQDAAYLTSYRASAIRALGELAGLDGAA